MASITKLFADGKTDTQIADAVNAAPRHTITAEQIEKMRNRPKLSPVQDALRKAASKRFSAVVKGILDGTIKTEPDITKVFGA